MKKIMIPLMLLSFNSFSYDPICEVYFELPRVKSSLIGLSEKTSLDFIRLNEKIAQSDQLDRQLAIIDHQFQSMIGLYQFRKQKILEKAVKYQSNEEYFKKYLNEKLTNMIVRNTNNVNTLTETLAGVLSKNNFPYKIKKHFIQSGDKKIMYKVIELDLDSFSHLKSYTFLQKYTRRFGVKKMTVNLFQNIDNGSLGFYSSGNDVLDIGVEGIKNLVENDTISFVLKHELRHASFKNMRVQGRDSRYHHSYLSLGNTPLTDEKVYTNYMSAEELYNFANNSYWGTDVLRLFRESDPKVIVNHLKNIGDEFKGSIAVARQSSKLAKFYQKLFQEMIKENTMGSFQLVLFNEAKQPVLSFGEATFIGVFNGADQRGVMFFLGDKIKQPAIDFSKKYELAMKKVNEKLNTTGKPTNKKEADEFMLKAIKQVENETMDERNALLKVLIQNQKEFEMVSNKMLANVSKHMTMHDKILRRYSKAIGNEKKMNPEYWEKQFRKVIQNAREYGKIARIKPKTEQ